MKDWNIIVTALPGIRHQHRLLQGLNLLGEFHPCEFKDVCIGRAENTERFLESVRQAIETGAEWTHDLGRVIPVEQTFLFTPETLEEQLKQAITPFAARIKDGSFYVRLERRGMLGSIMSPEVERAVADFLFTLAENQGKQLHVSFTDADYIVVAETIGNQCGIALITRDMQMRYPFVQPK